MKKHSVMFIILLLCCSLSLSACSDSSETENKNSDNQVSKNAVANICSLSNGEIIEEINGYDNLYTNDNLYVNVPTESCLYEYISKGSTNFDFKEYYDQFLSIYNYLFPDHEMNQDYFFYTGENSTVEYDENGKLVRNLNNVEDYYDSLANGTEGRVNLLYDETWNMDVTEWTSPICLELGSPIGYGYAVINKGNAAYLSGMIDDPDQGIRRYPILESYDPIDYFKVVGIYSPNSSKSFKLTDKTVSIKDGVDFFEEYVNNLPYPENATIDVAVSEVYVLEIGEDLFGYYFLTSGEYNNVPFDYMRNNISFSKFENYVFSGGNGFMLESNDVDVVYSLRRLQVIESPINIPEVISLDIAIKIVSESLTSNIQFEVQKIDFVYSEKMMTDNDGNIDYETFARNVSPSWKITLYNANDSLTYVCYVDAKDGGNFRYFTTPENMELIQ